VQEVMSIDKLWHNFRRSSSTLLLATRLSILQPVLVGFCNQPLFRNSIGRSIWLVRDKHNLQLKFFIVIVFWKIKIWKIMETFWILFLHKGKTPHVYLRLCNYNIVSLPQDSSTTSADTLENNKPWREALLSWKTNVRPQRTFSGSCAPSTLWNYRRGTLLRVESLGPLDVHHSPMSRRHLSM